jgi:hypothetical protein
MNEYLDANRQLWNAWTALHELSDFYDLPGFKAGKSSLRPIERAELTNVGGRSLLHLQCHGEVSRHAARGRWRVALQQAARVPAAFLRAGAQAGAQP